MEEEVLPIIPGRNPRRTPLDVHAASYLAASDNIASLSSSSMLLCREPQYIGGDGTRAKQRDNETKSCHSCVLLARTVVLVIV